METILRNLESKGTLREALETRTKILGIGEEGAAAVHRDGLAHEDLTLHEMNVLHVAARYHKQSLSVLLKFVRRVTNGAFLLEGLIADRRNRARQTPLHFAAKYLDDIRFVIYVHNTPYDVILPILNLCSEFIGMVKELDIGDRRGYTPLHLAVRQDNRRAVEQLLRAGAKLNIMGNPPKHQHTPLHRANSPEMVRFLLSKGAQLHPKRAAESKADSGQIQKEKTPLLNGETNPTAAKSPLITFLENFPSCAAAIYDCSVSTNGKNVGSRQLEIRYDFEVFNEADGAELSALSMMVQLNQEALLPHPICSTFVHIKRKMAKAHFVADILYTFLVICPTNNFRSPILT